ncbi:hypothetical protein SMICM304S_02182 [Streptomyces microflavus]
MATLPATAAITAATAGAVRPRLRAASRRAMRGVSGSRRPSRPRKPTITGMQPRRPSSARTEPPATRVVLPLTPPYTATAMPPASTTEPTIGSTRELRRVPRCPVSDSRIDWRPATIAGASAARTPVTRPSTAMARISQGRTVSSPKRLPVKSSIIGRNRTVRPNPAPTPATAPTPPSTAPPASTTARTWPRVPPHEPTRPSCRRERRAPTANAGPASSTISSTAMAATVRAAAVSSALSVSQPCMCAAMGTSESGGGSRAT